MERKTQLEPLSIARKKKDLFIAIAGAKRKTPSLTDHPACNESTESHPTAIASASRRLRIAESLRSGPADQMAQKGA
jgi:hypothetical protein